MNSRSILIKPIYPWLLITAFILQFNQQNNHILSNGEIIKLFILFSGSMAIICGTAFLYYKSLSKSIIFSFYLLLIEFYLPPLQDLLRTIPVFRYIAHYIVLIPLITSITIIIFIRIKTKWQLTKRAAVFLNSTFTIFILISLFQQLSIKQSSINEKSKIGIKNENIIRHPEIYLLIADEYAGKDQLTTMFHYENNYFDSSLEQRGFHWVKHPRSNYNFTPYSMASLFQMDYLKEVQPLSSETENRNIAFHYITENELTRQLKNNDFHITNASLFNFAGINPIAEANGFYENGFNQVLSQTFHGRLIRELSYHLLTTLNISYFQERYLKTLKDNILKTKERIITADTSGNNFIYGHFIMPHYPYLFNSYGTPLKYKQAMHANDPKIYLEYLQYSNEFFIRLIDSLQRKNPDAVIIIMSDHGFTKFNNTDFISFNFSNFISIYYPDKDYAGLPDSLSNVNLFRSVLNKQLNMNLRLQPHKEVLLIEK